MSREATFTLFYSSKKPGFLLIELLVALAFIGIIALGVGGYFYHIRASQSEGKNRLAALSLARTAMEHIYSGNQHAIPKDTKPYGIEVIINPPHNGFSIVRVVVSWQQKKGEMRAVTLDSGIYYENTLLG